MSARSDGTGKGATFEVTLPLLGATHDAVEPETSVPRSDSMCVLIVEDNLGWFATA